MRNLALALVLVGCTPTGEIHSRTEGSLSHSGLAWMDLVTRHPYDTLRVVIHHDRDHPPSAASLDLARDELARLATLGALDKPGGIEIVLGSVVEMSEADRSAVAIDGVLVSVARESDRAAVVNVLYADGAFVDDTDGRGVVLGYAYGGGYLVLLPDAIRATCRGGLGALTRGSCEVVEAMVLVHELGHLFGLVGNGAPTVTRHADADHGSHDISADCVMYWAIPRRDFAAALAESWLLGEAGMLRFDDACVEDLRAGQSYGTPASP